MNYQIGIVYMIICLSNPTIFYIGSTLKTIDERFIKHEQQYKYFTEGNYHNYSIYPYFTKYKLQNFKIIELKTYDVIDRQHLTVFEQLWINKYQRFKKIKVINILPAFNPIYLIEKKVNVFCGNCNKIIKLKNYPKHLRSRYCINYNSNV